MRYMIMSTRQSGFVDADGHRWFERDQVLGDTFESYSDEEAVKIAALSYEGEIVDLDDPRSHVMARSEDDHIATFVTDDDAPYILIREE